MKSLKNAVKLREINMENMHLFMTVISALVLLVHIGYLVLLKMAGSGFLSYINILSVFIYAFCLYNFYNKKYKKLSYFAFFAEIFFFSTLTTWSVKGIETFTYVMVPLIPFAALLGYMSKVRTHRLNFYFYAGVYILTVFLAVNLLKVYLFPELGFISFSPFYKKILCVYSSIVEFLSMVTVSYLIFSIAKTNHESQDFKIEKLSFKLFMTLSQTVEAKDIYTNGHSLRVASYSEMIAKAMGLSSEDQKKIYFCGLLHDIGKISIADYIINKAGKLTPDEYGEIKKHTVSGWNILSSIDEFPELAQVARWHHERYDGKGYPDGKKKDETPLFVRIVSVADAYDAMTSNRSYRSIMKRSEVIAILEEEKGKQFDPDVCEVFLKILSGDKNYDMREKVFEDFNIV